jgi:hypothetical protein
LLVLVFFVLSIFGSRLLSSGLSLLLACCACALDSRAELIYDVVELLELGVQGLDAVVLQVASGDRERVDQLFADLLRHLGAVLVDGRLGVVDHVVQLVPHLDGFLMLSYNYSLLLVLLLHLLSLVDHLVDLVFRETTGRLDNDGVVLSGALVFGGDLQDTVVVNFESDTDLGYTSRVSRTYLLAGKMPVRSNLPRLLLSAAISLSPWRTEIETAVWLS